MIKINLLPVEAGGKRIATGSKGKTKTSSSGAMTPFVLGLLVGFGVVGYFGWNVYEKAAKSRASVEQAKAQLKTLEDEIKKNESLFKDLTQQAQELEQKYAVIQALNPVDRVFWSEKLNQLAFASSLAAVYITRVRMDERVEEVETPESVKRRQDYEDKVKRAGKPLAEPPPPVVKMPIIHQTLSINALAYGNDTSQRLKQITLYQEGLKRMQWTRKSGKTTSFVDGFDPRFATGTHTLVTIGGVEVLQFSLTITAVPLIPKRPGTGAETGGTKP